MADVAANLYSWVTDASDGGGNLPINTTSVGTGLDDNLRQIQATVRAWLASKGADIASATTTDLGAVAGLAHDITGTTTITGFGTVSAGIWKILKFEGALTLTHNATSLILPGGVNITTQVGDVGSFISEGSGNWRCLAYLPMSRKKTVYIPASAMISRTTNGAAPGTAESSTNKVMYQSLDFDQTTQEYAQFSVLMPKSWNESTVTFKPVWTATSGTGTVAWSLVGVALSDDDAIDTAFGNEQLSSDTLIAANDIHIGPESSAITIGGTPAEGDYVVFQVARSVGSDTLTADARLLGLHLYITVNTENDT